MKLSNYLIQYLQQKGVTYFFVLIGGACAHIIDSIARRKNVNYICFQHEQAAGIAADAYTRLTDSPAAAVVTSGPGATNIITAVASSWFDSIPVIIISGQVNLNQTKGRKKIRQLGFQETDIVGIIKSLTKYAVMVTNPNQIKYSLDKAFFLAKKLRPGPVWVDIPLNIQHAQVKTSLLKNYRFKEHTRRKEDVYLLENQVNEALKLISFSKRPVILAGFGIRVARATSQFRKIIELLGFPVVSTWSGKDILPYNHPQNIGTIGVYGERAANFAVQNSDLLLSIGSRLDTRQTGGEPQTFARNAKKIVVDIDKGELSKNWVKAQLPINCDAKDFLIEINKQLVDIKTGKFLAWIKRCKDWQKMYPSVMPYYHKQKHFVNPYVFIEKLSVQVDNNSVVVCDIGAVTAWVMQTFQVKEGQRLISALGCGPMGYALPASVGAYYAGKDKQIICITGDGGMQVNIQELQTIAHYKLPVKIFILNNKSYGIIKQFQDTYFDSKYEASAKGYSAPDFVKVGKAYGLTSLSIKNHEKLEEKIRIVLRQKGATLCDIQISPDQKIIPKLEAVKTRDGQYIAKPIDDQWPYLNTSSVSKNAKD